MQKPYINKLSFDSNPFKTSLTPTGHVQMKHIVPEAPVQGPSFQNILSDGLSGVSQTLSAPDALMKDAMTTGNVDVHDVMIANAKAELAVNVTAQVVTKVVQAYDRILQIQI